MVLNIQEIFMIIINVLWRKNFEKINIKKIILVKKITLLKLLNFFILQLFTIRLVRNGEYDVGTGIFYQTSWSWLFFIIPFSGWDNKYKYIFKRRLL